MERFFASLRMTGGADGKILRCAQNDKKGAQNDRRGAEGRFFAALRMTGGAEGKILRCAQNDKKGAQNDKKGAQNDNGTLNDRGRKRDDG